MNSPTVFIFVFATFFKQNKRKKKNIAHALTVLLASGKHLCFSIWLYLQARCMHLHGVRICSEMLDGGLTVKGEKIKKDGRLHWCQNESQNSQSAEVFLVSSSHHPKRTMIAMDVFFFFCVQQHPKKYTVLSTSVFRLKEILPAHTLAHKP